MKSTQKELALFILEGQRFDFNTRGGFLIG